MIFVIDDDVIMAECVARAAEDDDTMIFADAISAMAEIAEGTVPDIIFLDILLDGPDGFTFLNELVSYGDTAKIPIVIVTSLDLKMDGLEMYGVVGVLNKDSMRPEDIKEYVRRYKKRH